MVNGAIIPSINPAVPIMILYPPNEAGWGTGVGGKNGIRTTKTVAVTSMVIGYVPVTPLIPYTLAHPLAPPF